MDMGILGIVLTIVGLYGSTMAILLSHERRLTRIEGKLDVILQYIRNNRKE